MELTRSAAAYLEQATLEISQNVSFSNEEDFKEWVLVNIESILLKASELNQQVIKKIDSATGVKIKELIGTKVWEECQILKARKRARLELNHTLSCDN